MTRRWRRGGAGIGIALGLYLLVGLARWRYFALQGAELVRVAQGFPKEYRIGRPSERDRPLGLDPVANTLVLGDSTALGVGVPRVQETLPYLVAQTLRRGAHIDNVAVSGATVEDAVREQVPRIPAQRYGNAIVCLSANDATHGTSPESFERSLRTLLTALDGLDLEGPVFVTTTPNFWTTPALPFVLNRLFERRASALSGIVRRVAGEYLHLAVVVDLFERGTLLPDEYAADGFHPNAAGYRRWAEVFASARKRP